MLALLAARDMAAERRRAAALDRRHHLQLAEAQMTGLGATPGRPVGAEDIRDLQSRAGHPAAASGGRCHDEVLQRARDLADGARGDLGVERRRVEPLVAERTRAIMLISLCH